jgi:hypothetical protein
MKEHNSGTLFLVAVAIGLAGWFIGNGFYKGRAADRYVTVKGVAERDVTADVALWPLKFVATDDDLSKAQAAITASGKKTMDFLIQQGITKKEVEPRQLSVNDQFANPYRSGPVQSRYIIEQTLMVRTERCEAVARASQAVGDLVAAGVVLSSQGTYGGAGGPTFLFTRLNDLKPEMIAEATSNARAAAEQFAKDSGSETGKIRKANQGVFVILPRDRAPGIFEANQINKTVRVVSTVEYYLED